MDKEKISHFSSAEVHKKSSVIRLGRKKNKDLLPSITLDDLPPVGTTRWVTRRKAALVTAVRSGLITLEDACERYTLSVEEFIAWQELIDRHGTRGLRATRVRDYRDATQQTKDVKPTPSRPLHLWRSGG